MFLKFDLPPSSDKIYLRLINCSLSLLVLLNYEELRGKLVKVQHGSATVSVKRPSYATDRLRMRACWEGEVSDDT